MTLNSNLNYKCQTTLPHPYPKYTCTTHPVNITKLHPSLYASLQTLTVIKNFHWLNSHQLHDAMIQSTPYPPTIQKQFFFPQITYITEITPLTPYMVDKTDTRTSYGSGWCSTCRPPFIGLISLHSHPHTYCNLVSAYLSPLPTRPLNHHPYPYVMPLDHTCEATNHSA